MTMVLNHRVFLRVRDEQNTRAYVSRKLSLLKNVYIKLCVHFCLPSLYIIARREEEGVKHRKASCNSMRNRAQSFGGSVLNGRERRRDSRDLCRE